MVDELAKTNYLGGKLLPNMNPSMSPSKGIELTFHNQESSFKDCVDEGILDASTHEDLKTYTKKSY